MPSNLSSTLTLAPMDIILFQIERLENNSCQLKDFLYFLNWMRAPKPLKFSYVPSRPLLHGGLSLKDNILLESVPNSLTISKEFQLKNSLDRTGNEYLWQLFKEIPSLNAFPHEVDPVFHKIIALIKALLRPVDYLLLENPQEGLSPNLQELLIESLKFQAQDLKKIILIYGPSAMWVPHCNKKICEHEKSTYSVSPIDLQVDKDKERENVSLRFHNFDHKKEVA
ncbi:MAG: hypothetical protein WCG27_03715 [Pseudomonadota bacterium]